MSHRPSKSAVIYEGRAASAEGILADHLAHQISNAIFRGDQISIEWPETYGEKALTTLTKTTGSEYHGHCIWASGTPKEERATVEAILYSNEIGHVLVGTERWESAKTDWFIVQFANGRPA